MIKARWYGDRAKQAARRGAVRGLSQWADDVLTQAQADTPVAVGRANAGYLRGTGQADVDAGALRAAVSFGSGDNIAVYVHERMDVRHTVGKAKFLEGAVNESKKSGPETVRREIKAALE